METGSHGPERDVHHFGDLFVTELLDLAKNEGRAKIRGHLAEQLLDDQSVFHDRALGFLYGVELGRLHSPGPQAVHTEADANPVEVAAEGAVIPKAMQLAEGLEERLLGDVFRFVPIPKDVGRRPDDPRSMAGDHHAQRRLVALAATLEPVKFLVQSFLEK